MDEVCHPPLMTETVGMYTINPLASTPLPSSSLPRERLRPFATTFTLPPCMPPHRGRRFEFNPSTQGFIFTPSLPDRQPSNVHAQQSTVKPGGGRIGTYTRTPQPSPLLPSAWWICEEALHRALNPFSFRDFSPYTSILGDIWLHVSVPWASSALDEWKIRWANKPWVYHAWHASNPKLPLSSRWICFLPDIRERFWLKSPAIDTICALILQTDRGES